VIGRVYAPGYAASTPSNLTTAVSDMQFAYTAQRHLLEGSGKRHVRYRVAPGGRASIKGRLLSQTTVAIDAATVSDQN